MSGFFITLKGSTSIVVASSESDVSISVVPSDPPSSSLVLKTTSPRSFALSYIMSALLPSLPK